MLRSRTLSPSARLELLLPWINHEGELRKKKLQSLLVGFLQGFRGSGLRAQRDAGLWEAFRDDPVREIHEARKKILRLLECGRPAPTPPSVYRYPTDHPGDPPPDGWRTGMFAADDSVRNLDQPDPVLPLNARSLQFGIRPRTGPRTRGDGRRRRATAGRAVVPGPARRDGRWRGHRPLRGARPRRLGHAVWPVLRAARPRPAALLLLAQVQAAAVRPAARRGRSSGAPEAEGTQGRAEDDISTTTHNAATPRPRLWRDRHRSADASTGGSHPRARRALGRGLGHEVVVELRTRARVRPRARRSSRVGPRPGLRAGQLPSPRPALRHPGLVFHTTSPEAADVPRRGCVCDDLPVGKPSLPAHRGRRCLNPSIGAWLLSNHWFTDSRSSVECAAARLPPIGPRSRPLARWPDWPV